MGFSSYDFHGDRAALADKAVEAGIVELDEKGVPVRYSVPTEPYEMAHRRAKACADQLCIMWFGSFRPGTALATNNMKKVRQGYFYLHKAYNRLAAKWAISWTDVPLWSSIKMVDEEMCPDGVADWTLEGYYSGHYAELKSDAMAVASVLEHGHPDKQTRSKLNQLFLVLSQELRTGLMDTKAFGEV